jgi:hypothetical protein
MSNEGVTLRAISTVFSVSSQCGIVRRFTQPTAYKFSTRKVHLYKYSTTVWWNVWTYWRDSVTSGPKRSFSNFPSMVLTADERKQSSDLDARLFYVSITSKPVTVWASTFPNAAWKTDAWLGTERSQASD